MIQQPPSQRAGALELMRIDYSIGGARILHQIDLSIAAGELVGVIGPNGAGKSTLFNVISGLIKPTAGSVAMNGEDVTALSVPQRARRGLGRTFQTSSVFGSLTVLENVRLAAQAAYGHAASLLAFPRPSDEATQKAHECLAQVALDERVDHIAGALSHGDKRKLEIAMLIAGEPRLILLDEPLAGVGSGDLAPLGELIGSLRSEQRTVLMVEHHLELLFGLVDRVLVLHHGELLAYDVPEAVMADPVVQEAYLGEAV